MPVPIIVTQAFGLDVTVDPSVPIENAPVQIDFTIRMIEPLSGTVTYRGVPNPAAGPNSIRIQTTPTNLVFSGTLFGLAPTAGSDILLDYVADSTEEFRGAREKRTFKQPPPTG